MSDTTMTNAVIDLFTSQLDFELPGTIRADQRRMATDDTDWRLAMFHAETNEEVHADHWERHTHGDEAVCCLRGGMRLYLRATRPGAPDDVIPLLPGRAAIVPRGRWHRFELDEPSDLMAVTIPRGTQHERRAE